MKFKYKLGFIGAGNMAKAIVSGIIKSNILNKEDVILSCATKETEYDGVKVITDNNVILSQCRYVVLAIKPQVFNSIYNTFSSSNCECVMSIMAGVKSDKIKNAFSNNPSVIRIMPNTPVSVGLGMSCIANNNASEENNAFAKSIFDAIGKTLYVDESLFDAVTSISGSGPAYVYYFINAMIKGGMLGGLSFDQAKTLTIQTIQGASKMVQEKDEDLSTLIQNVCSKGGTTIQAIDTFKSYELEDKIKEGINKCRIRSEELSK